jgi:hypothetical protein
MDLRNGETGERPKHRLDDLAPTDPDVCEDASI